MNANARVQHAATSTANQMKWNHYNNKNYKNNNVKQEIYRSKLEILFCSLVKTSHINYYYYYYSMLSFYLQKKICNFLLWFFSKIVNKKNERNSSKNETLCISCVSFVWICKIFQHWTFSSHCLYVPNNNIWNTMYMWIKRTRWRQTFKCSAIQCSHSGSSCSSGSSFFKIFTKYKCVHLFYYICVLSAHVGLQHL